MKNHLKCNKNKNGAGIEIRKEKINVIEGIQF